MCVGNREGDVNFIYAMKLVPLEDLGYWEAKMSKCRNLSMQALFSIV